MLKLPKSQPNIAVISNRLTGLLNIPEEKKEAVIANLMSLIKYTISQTNKPKRKIKRTIIK